MSTHHLVDVPDVDPGAPAGHLPCARLHHIKVVLELITRAQVPLLSFCHCIILKFETSDFLIRGKF